MDKKILKERLEDVKKQLRTNAKDVHFFDKLIDEALSLKGQMGVEPMFASLAENDIINRMEGKNFELVYTNTHAGYRLGGYTILVQNHYALGGQIVDYIDTMKGIDTLDEKQREIFEFDLESSLLNFNAILFAANDFNFRYKLNELVVNYFIEKQNALNTELQKETAKEDEAFKTASFALSDMMKALEEED